MARKISKAQAILSVLVFLRKRLRRLFKLYKFESTGPRVFTKSPLMLKTLQAMTNRRLEQGLMAILKFPLRQYHVGTKIRQFDQILDNVLRNRCSIAFKLLASSRNNSLSQPARLLLHLLNTVTNRQNRFFTIQTFHTLLKRPKPNLAAGNSLTTTPEQQTAALQTQPLMSGILAAVLQNQTLLLDTLGSQGWHLSAHSPERQRALLNLAHIRDQTVFAFTKRSFRVWAGAKALYGRVVIRRRVEELDGMVSGLKEQVEAKCSSAYQSGPGRGVLADMLASGEESRELMESNRNLKDELALSYLHFVESQNNQLLQQRDEQRAAIARLEELIQSNKLTN